MDNLLKMDMRRLIHSKMFVISMIIVAGLNLVTGCGFTYLVRLFTKTTELTKVDLSDLITTPFVGSLFVIALFVSLINFSFADIANGYIKNIAGQVRHRRDVVVSKFVVIGLHNIIFMLVGVLSHILGYVILKFTGAVELRIDENIVAAIVTLILKWMLVMSISAILMFFTNGIRNKTLAVVTGVIIGTGALGLAYVGLNVAVNNIFKMDNFDIADFMPDSLMKSIDYAGANLAFINAIVVSIVVTLVFMGLTIKVFNSRDVK